MKKTIIAFISTVILSGISYAQQTTTQDSTNVKSSEEIQSEKKNLRFPEKYSENIKKTYIDYSVNENSINKESEKESLLFTSDASIGILKTFNVLERERTFPNTFTSLNFNKDKNVLVGEINFDSKSENSFSKSMIYLPTGTKASGFGVSTDIDIKKLDLTHKSFILTVDVLLSAHAKNPGKNDILSSVSTALIHDATDSHNASLFLIGDVDNINLFTHERLNKNNEYITSLDNSVTQYKDGEYNNINIIVTEENILRMIAEGSNSNQKLQNKVDKFLEKIKTRMSNKENSVEYSKKLQDTFDYIYKDKEELNQIQGNIEQDPNKYYVKAVSFRLFPQINLEDSVPPPYGNVNFEIKNIKFFTSVPK